jgi:ribosomal protein S6E (S10)
MKLNISYPANGSQKLIDSEDERKLRVFMEKRMGAEVPGDSMAMSSRATSSVSLVETTSRVSP